MLTSILLPAVKAHLASITLEQKKLLLESVRDCDQWQECIDAILDMTENDVFQSEFSIDIASVNTSALMAYEQTGCVVRELELRSRRPKLWESFEKWTLDMNDKDEHYTHPELVDLRKRYAVCFMDAFRNTEGEWEVWKFTSTYKNEEERNAQNVVLHRIIMAHLSTTYFAWLESAFAYFIRYLGSSWSVYHQNKFDGFVRDHCIKMMVYLKNHGEQDFVNNIKRSIVQAYVKYSNKIWTCESWVGAALSVQMAVPEYTELYNTFEKGLKYKCMVSKVDCDNAVSWRSPPDDRMTAIMRRHLV